MRFRTPFYRLRRRTWYALDCPPTIRDELVRRMLTAEGSRAPARSNVVLHRPPAPAGTPCWEPCQDCEEMIRTDSGRRALHACPVGGEAA